MGILTLIKTLTADNDSSLAFVDGTASVVFDATYDEYMFVCTDINPATDGAHFGFQVNVAGGDSYDETITSSGFWATQQENAGSAALAYYGGLDLTQETDLQNLIYEGGNDADESSAGILHLYSPSSTTYVKHFVARFQSTSNAASPQSSDNIVAGYINVTAAVDEIEFKCSSGNFDGVIQMYGVA